MIQYTWHLLGEHGTVCGIVAWQRASWDIKKVTCKTCLKKGIRIMARRIERP